MSAKRPPTSDTMLQNGATNLTAEQFLALEGLLSGKTISAVATRVNVSRSTIHRWLKDDYEFQAAMNQGRRELSLAIQDVLLQIAHTATETVADAVTAGDVRAALAVLKGLGALSGDPPEIGPEDPMEVRDEAECAAAEAEGDRMLRKILAG